MRELIKNKNIYLQFIFHCIIGKKSSPQNLQIFRFFTNFQDFHLKLWDLYLLQGMILMPDFFLPQIQLFKLYKIGYLSVDSETLEFFWGGTPWNRPTGRWGPIVLIFELDRDINKTVLCTKFHHNRISLCRVIVLTDGEPYWPIL